MIIQLLPEQVPGFWFDIKESIQAAVPSLLHDSPEKMNNILMSILIGRMQVWVVVDQQESGTIVQGIIITTVMTEECSGTRILLFYSGYSIGEASIELWKEGMQIFNGYAKSKGCEKLGLYTQLPYMKKHLAMLGASEDTFMFWDVIGD
ncbi:hypothetical protein KAR91_15755 [Candidatus Pacearchaeota archaeon]|nr:hypothetical protein [Candidatus Pacearchaeota archaeon]